MKNQQEIHGVREDQDRWQVPRHGTTGAPTSQSRERIGRENAKGRLVGAFFGKGKYFSVAGVVDEVVSEEKTRT